MRSTCWLLLAACCALLLFVGTGPAADEDWGTAFAAKVQGIPVGTTCKMWVTYTDGTRAYVTAWMTGVDEGKVYYWGSLAPTAKVPQNFEIIANNRTLVTVAA